MQLPPALIQSLRETPGFDEGKFRLVHETQDIISSIRLNKRKTAAAGIQQVLADYLQQPVPWCGRGFYLEKRPNYTFDPLFHAGLYYVQEASSMFLEQALLQTTDLAKPLRVLDLCAAPGGKSTHIQSLISTESLLVSNEVIKSRAAVLKENMIKWGGSNVAVTCNDPADFKKLTGYFDVIVVDAPCSGSGLFRKDEDAIHEWSEDNVRLCSRRQERILADILPALKQDGLLIYSTCSYSPQEDEAIMDWLTQKFSLQTIPLQIDEAWGIQEAKSRSAIGYRFWPYNLKGEGFFLAVFKKEKDSHSSLAAARPLKKIPAKELNAVTNFLDISPYDFVRFSNNIYAWNKGLVEDFTLLSGQLSVLYSGIQIGEIIREKLIPAHALALSGQVQPSFSTIELTATDATAYLQKKEINLQDHQPGWYLMRYKGCEIGWAKVLANRVNNYYPKEWRIRKDNP